MRLHPSRFLTPAPSTLNYFLPVFSWHAPAAKIDQDMKKVDEGVGLFGKIYKKVCSA